MAAWLLAGGGAMAQPEPESSAAVGGQPVAQPGNASPDQFFASLVNALDSTDFNLRQQATEQLAIHDLVTLEMIEQRLRSDTSLTPEQRQRLMEAGRQRFGRTPRAAMGVMFDQMGPLRDRIVVDRTFEKFPSFTVLQEGDIIDSAAGVRLIGPSARIILRSIIFSRDPGEELDVVIRRGAERLTVKLALGRYQDLDNNAPLDEPSLTRAWRVRTQQGAGRGWGAEPIRSGMTAEQWKDANNENRQRQLATAKPKVRAAAAGGVPPVAGGTPRARASDEGAMAQWNSRRDPDDQMLELAGLRFGQLTDDGDALAKRTMSTEEELSSLEQMVEMAKNRSLKDPDIVMQQGQRVPARPAAESAVERQVRLFEKQIAAVKAEAEGK